MQLNLQDAYLGQLKKDNLLVVVYLVNGFQLKGSIKGFDNFTIFLENEGKIQMVYKHSVTTINPIKSISMSFLSDAFKTTGAAPREGAPAPAVKREMPIIPPNMPRPSAVREII
jgi:host factor-I protein